MHPHRHIFSNEYPPLLNFEENQPGPIERVFLYICDRVSISRKINGGKGLEHTVIINGLPIRVSKLVMGQLKKDEELRTLIDMEFKVSSEDYHDVTSILYKNNFAVQIPSEDIEMEATIYNYYTSITNLYKKGNVGDFKLVLLEKK